MGRGLWRFLGRQQIACVGAQPDGARSRDGASDEDEPLRSGAYAGLALTQRSKRIFGGDEVSALVLRRAAGRESD